MWQEEVIVRVNPAEVIGRKSSGWDYAMNVRVKGRTMIRWRRSGNGAVLIEEERLRFCMDAVGKLGQ